MRNPIVLTQDMLSALGEMKPQPAHFFRAKRFYDSRGWVGNINPSDFVESEPERFVHSFIALSQQHTLRGFHFQNEPATQEKVVHVIQGQILDVSFRLDDTANPPYTFNAYLGDDFECDTALLASNLAHAYFVLSETAILLYMNSAPYDANSAQVINPLDEDIGFDWGVPTDRLIISDRDRAGMSLSKFRSFE